MPAVLYTADVVCPLNAPPMAVNAPPMAVGGALTDGTRIAAVGPAARLRDRR